MNSSVVVVVSLILDMRPSATGSIIAVVAVLLTHMLISAVEAKRPSTERSGLEPADLIIRPAMRRSRSCLCIAAANAKPPRNRKITGFAKWLRASFTSNMPVSTARMGTSSAVIVIGRASVNQRTAMKTRMERPFSMFFSTGRKK